MTVEEENVFDIKIDFEKGKGDPARVFRTMTGLIESVQSLDYHLAQSINVSIQAKITLEDIEVGSLRAKLKNIVEQTTDDTLKKHDIVPAVGQYLQQAKHKVVDWCTGKNEIKDRTEVQQLQKQILQLAEKTDVNHLPAYAPLETEALLSDINSIQESLSYLEKGDNATLNSQQGTSNFNPSLQVSPIIVREMLTKENIENVGIRILKVKKPDFLGNSKWSCKYKGTSYDAAINDKQWLIKFQNRLVNLQPGDAIKAKVREIVSYGYYGEIVNTDYEVLEVIEVLHAQRLTQRDLLDE